MNEKKTYSIVELAEMLNVPRTTLNDWLTVSTSTSNVKPAAREKFILILRLKC